MGKEDRELTLTLQIDELGVEFAGVFGGSTDCRLDGTPHLQLVTASGGALALPQTDMSNSPRLYCFG